MRSLQGRQLLRVGRCAQISAKQAKSLQPTLQDRGERAQLCVPSPLFSTSLILSLTPLILSLSKDAQRSRAPHKTKGQMQRAPCTDSPLAP